MTIMMAFSMAACSEKNTPADELEELKPPTTVDDADWQTVPAAGGTIGKDDISITFPSGTFSGNTQVAISNVSKGKVYGDYEVSPFYQIVMPVTTHTPTTIKIKSNQLDDDVRFVFSSEGYALSSGKNIESNNVLEATYANGEYTVTLPAFENGEDTKTDYFTIGLARTLSLTAETRASGVLEEGTVKGIKWELLAEPSAKESNYYEKVVNYRENQKVKQYITDALSTITDLGFKLNGTDRVIRYYYYNTFEYGLFVQSKWSDKNNCIQLGVDMIGYSLLTGQKSDLASTVLHETFHLFQSEYDPRSAYRKAGGFLGYSADNENILYEMGAVWIEQFANDGQLKAEWLKNDIFKKAFHRGSDLSSDKDKLGMSQETSRWGNGQNTGENRSNSYQMQGYTMGPWLYYMTTQMKSDGFSKNSVLELHELWRKNWKSDTHNAYYILEDWLKLPNHQTANTVNIFDGCNIDDYYLMLLQGKLVKDLDIGQILQDHNHFVISEVGTKYSFEGKVYPNGCAVRKVSLTGFKGVSLEEKELVIKQESSDVHTYVAITQKKTNHSTYNLAQRSGEVRVIELGDSILIKGPTLEQLRESDGSIETNFYLITTNTFNFLHDTKTRTNKPTIELRNKKEEENQQELNIQSITFEAKVSAKSENYDFFADDPNYKFQVGNYNGASAENVSVKTTKNGNTLHVEFTNNYTYYSKDYIQQSLSFDIDGFDGDMKSWVINNVKAYYSVDDIAQHDVPIIGTKTWMSIMEASNVGIVMDECTFSTVEGSSSMLVFRAKPSSGLSVSHFAGYIENFYQQSTNYSYVNDPDNYVEIVLWHDKVYPMK